MVYIWANKPLWMLEEHSNDSQITRLGLMIYEFSFYQHPKWFIGLYVNHRNLWSSQLDAATFVTYVQKCRQ